MGRGWGGSGGSQETRYGSGIALIFVTACKAKKMKKSLIFCLTVCLIDSMSVSIKQGQHGVTAEPQEVVVGCC